VVGEALGHFRNELLDEVERIIDERVEQLRPDVNKSHDGDYPAAAEPAAEAKQWR
jgi:hypothetical protein